VGLRYIGVGPVASHDALHRAPGDADGSCYLALALAGSEPLENRSCGVF